MEVCERLVMPGDDVTEDTEDKAGVVLGPGLRREAGDQVNCDWWTRDPNAICSSLIGPGAGHQARGDEGPHPAR